MKKLLAGGCAAAALALFLPTGGTAQAAATTHYWYGTVTRVVDGDTVMVDVAGDGRGAVPVRNAALQTTELHRSTSSPECHATQAFTRMSQLLPVGKKVRLAAYRAGSTSGVDAYGATRYVRYIDARNDSTGAYSVDVQKTLIREGHGLWKAEPVEGARQAAYHVAMQQAMREHHNIWNSGLCGVGPAASAHLRMWINYEADGVDTSNLNGEWLRLMNGGSTTVSLAGWKLRDASLVVGRDYAGHPIEYFTFPAGTTLAPGEWLTVYPTRGVSGGKTFYLNEPTLPFFPNVTNPAAGYPGKSVYLVDPALDFRAVATYPCLAACTTPHVHISKVSPATMTEYIDLRVNSGTTTTQDLTGVVVTNDGWVKELRPGTRLAPGQTLRVYVQGKGTDTNAHQYWRHQAAMLENGGDTVVLRTATGRVASTYRYGTG